MASAEDVYREPGLPGFPRQEYEARLARLQGLLGESGLSGALLSNASNVSYYSGFRTTIRASNLVWAMLVVPANGEPHAVVSQPLSNLFRETAWVPNVHAFGGSPHWRLPTDPVELSVEVVRLSCGSVGRLGIERGAGMRAELTIEEATRLESELADRELVDLAPLIWRQRVIKTPWEQDIYRRLGRLAAAGFKSGLAAIRAGVSEQELERTMWHTFLDGGADGSPVGGQLMIRSGPERFLTFCGRASKRRLRSGDQIMLAGGPMVDGYHIDIHRFACLAPAPRLQRALHEQSEAGLAAAIGAARPGNTTGAVFRAGLEAMGRRQATAVVPWRVFGHGLGLDNYEPPMISSGDATEIKEGMVLALEVPAYDIPQARVMGAFLEECVLVTGVGAEVLTRDVARALWIAD